MHDLSQIDYTKPMNDYRKHPATPIPVADLPLYAEVIGPKILVTHKHLGGVARIYDSIEAAKIDEAFMRMCLYPDSQHTFYDLKPYQGRMQLKEVGREGNMIRVEIVPDVLSALEASVRKPDAI